MRKEVPEIGWGDFEVLKVRDPAVLAMRYDWRNNSVVVHAQPARGAARDSLSTSGGASKGKLLINLLAKNTAKPTSQANTALCSKVMVIAGIASAVSITC